MNLDTLFGVTIGFLVVGVVIAAGYFSKRSGLITENGEVILNRVAFYLMSPPLYVVVLSSADPKILTSPYFVSTLIGILVTVTFVVVALLFVMRRKHGIISTAIYSGATIFTNTSNIGIPLALYVIGNTDYIAPVILLQVLILSPTLLILLELLHGGEKLPLRKTLIKPFKNPIVIGSLIGTTMLLFGWKLPQFLYEPMNLLGRSSIPMLLLAFGVSIYGSRPLREPGLQLPEVLTAIFAKTVVMPVSSILIGVYGFNMSGIDLFALALVSALPAGQTVYNFAINYQILRLEIRDVALVSTMLSVPTSLLIALAF